MAEVPKLNVSQAKLDKLAADLEKLEVAPVVKVGDGTTAVPMFQRQGYLEKLGHTRRKWFKRFFVLRDSFLLSYNLQKSDYTVEPRSCVHLGNSKIQLLSHEGKDHCFFVTTMEKDQFLFAASSEEERAAWIKDIEVARTITHANMVKLAVENQCLAEEKGVADVTRDKSTSDLSLFSNPEYIKNTPLTGGAEGWLRTFGFNPDASKTAGTFMSRKSQLVKCYFILRDSHLLMFHGGDILTKPRGVMYLVGTATEANEVEEGMFRFMCKSSQCGDMIELVATSEKQRSRWIQALKIGSRVTYPDFKLLLKEHELLAALTMTPRAAPPSRPNAPAEAAALPPSPLLAEDVDLQGQQLDPGTHQPYDERGHALFRSPEGKLVNADGVALASKTPRFTATGQQLDPFNRALPPGAVPMFAADGTPIGVGPDGKHYLPDGTEIGNADAHFDAEGNQLGQDIVDRAGAIAGDISKAIKVRARLAGDGVAAETVDALGRTFRESKDAKSGTLVNADGDKVSVKSARRVETSTGQLVEYDPVLPSTPEKVVLTIFVDEEGDEREIGEVEISYSTTLRELRHLINHEVETQLPDFVFLINNIALMRYEENSRLAEACAPRITIRGKELKTIDQPKKFMKKTEELATYEEQKKKERSEFEEIMAKVRQGQFLKTAKPTAESD
jgi:hypothetical protein